MKILKSFLVLVLMGVCFCGNSFAKSSLHTSGKLTFFYNDAKEIGDYDSEVYLVYDYEVLDITNFLALIGLSETKYDISSLQHVYISDFFVSESNIFFKGGVGIGCVGCYESFFVKLDLNDFSYESISYPKEISINSDKHFWVNEDGILNVYIKKFFYDSEYGHSYHKIIESYYYDEKTRIWIESSYNNDNEEILFVNEQGYVCSKNGDVLDSSGDVIFEGLLGYNETKVIGYSEQTVDFLINKSIDGEYQIAEVENYQDREGFISVVKAKNIYEFIDGKIYDIEYDSVNGEYYFVGENGIIFKNNEQLDSPFGDNVVYTDIEIFEKGFYVITEEGELARYYNHSESYYKIPLK